MMLPKVPEWLMIASGLSAASFIAHFVAAISQPGTGSNHRLPLSWYATSVPTCITLGLIGGFIGDVMHLGPIGTAGASALLGWMGTAALTALFQTVIDRIKNFGGRGGDNN